MQAHDQIEIFFTFLMLICAVILCVLIYFGVKRIICGLQKHINYKVNKKVRELTKW